MIANVTIASSVVGVLTPVLSLILIVMIRWGLHGRVNGLERALTETENEIKGEIQNGVTDKLSEVSREVKSVKAHTENVERKV